MFRQVLSKCNLETPCQARGVLDFHKRENNSLPALRIDSYQYYWQSPHPERGLRKINSSSAPNPVTRLWTACTRLKIQMLQSAIFD
jgi:hypothetical protein